jgi:membrane-associated phospholipid phosphatase
MLAAQVQVPQIARPSTAGDSQVVPRMAPLEKLRVNRYVVRFLTLALFVAADAAPPAAAQVPEPPRANSRLFTERDAIAAGIATAATLALAAFDRPIAEAISDPAGPYQRNRFLGARASEFNHVNEQTLTLAGLALYGIGRLSHSPTLADVSFHMAEAVVVASVVSQLIRLPVGRERPIVPSNRGSDPFVFRPFKGFRNRDYRAFPSIHSASGFAAAAVLSGEVARRWPDARWYASPLLYGLAATPGLSRMYMNQHWASDVLMGAFIGVVAGQKVVRYNHVTNPRNRVNRFFLGSHADVAPQGKRILLRLTRPF